MILLRQYTCCQELELLGWKLGSECLKEFSKEEFLVSLIINIVVGFQVDVVFGFLL